MSHLPTQPPSSAVEVVAMFGDSIVGVRHVSDPHGGVVRPTTRALVAGGAAGILAGVAAFLAATRVAAANHAALTAWLAAKRPAWAFRPDAVPTWLSVVSMLGLTLGLTALVTGLTRRKRELEPARVSIGSAAGVDFAIADAAAPTQALVAPAGDGFALDLTGLTGEIAGPDGARPIAPATAQLPVTPGLRVRAARGAVAFHIAAVEAPRRQTTPVLALLDRRALGYLAASAAAHLALWAFSRTVPPEANAAQVDQDDYIAVSLATSGTENDTMPPPVDPAVDPGDGTADGMAAMALESGTVGDAHDRSTDPAKRKIRDDDPAHELARREALANAASVGILGSTALADGDAFASLVGTGSTSSGFDDLDIAGAIAGDGVGAPTGFGQGVSGNRFGGGGTAFTVGGYNTIRNGKQVGEGWGVPGGRGCTATSGVCRPHVPKPPVVLGRPEGLTGDYDGDIIRRYVKRKLPQIAYCYEKRLLVKPDIAGTVMAEWTINMAGLVQSPTASGVDPEVARCIADVVSTISFPKPPQVGLYKVRYPFVLHKSGQ